MTSIATLPQQGTALAAAGPEPIQMVPVQTDTTMSLSGWASEMAHAFQIASTICQTSFVPQHFRNKPEETASAILYGSTLGIPPMVAPKNIYVVHGTPALYAKMKAGVAISKGHEIERVSATMERVEFRCRRRGSNSWQTVVWDIDRATLAGYTSNDQYRKNPIGMLTAKCQSEAAELVAPDALAGLVTVEEMQLGDTATGMVPGLEDMGEAAAATAPAKRTVSRKKATPAPAPSLPEVVQDAPEEADEVDADPATGELADEVDTTTIPATSEQIDQLVTLMKAAGHTTKAQMGAAIAEALGEKKSATELSSFEADTLATYFEAAA
ncbi:hypothetical protein [Galactobacter valiniphilus]|uniref:hypothetical protein n=1 Tax=Galactobacter valiniphilus TaxID=2676122 RepID=UPI003736F3E0